jgi:hypothetical protein
MPDDHATDPYYQLVLETTNAIVTMSRAIEAHDGTLGETKVLLGDVKTLLARIAAAEEAANQAQAGRWSDVKAAVAALYANTIVSGALALALSMLAIGLVLWILSLLGVDVDQVIPWVKGTPP